jgi:predicted P-loop ATPase
MVERIPNLLDGYLQGEPKEIYRRYLECFFISAVARVMQPGCKADTALILQGAQGVRKSSFFRCLMPQESWFSDDMGSLETKDAQMAIGRSWIVEWAELESLRRSNVNSVKAFLSRQVDQFRPPYGREIIDVPRSAIIVGSTNEAQFLTDSTGSRRYMVIPVVQIDTDAVVAMRDQLWAEAYAKWLAKVPWYLTQEERVEQEAQNAEMTSDDPWLSAITTWLPTGGLFSSTGYKVTMSRILGSCLEIPKERQTRSAQMRVSSILAELGWVRKNQYYEDQKQWLYVAPEGWGQ